MRQSKPFRRTAIVVEDDALQREMIAMLLEESNFDVIQCEDAETAAPACEQIHPALIVTDVDLSGSMDGLDLAHHARQHITDVRIIVISGSPLPRPLPTGAKFFSKPVCPITLLREATH